MTTHQPPAQFSLSVEPYKVTSAARQFSEPVTLAKPPGIRPLQGLSLIHI